MSRSTMFLELAILGAIAPYVFFIQFFGSEGIAGNFLGALYVNGAAGGIATDLFISSLVFWLFLFPEARRVGVKRPWIYMVINLVIGLSCAVPLFLWARERANRSGAVTNYSLTRSASEVAGATHG